MFNEKFPPIPPKNPENFDTAGEPENLDAPEHVEEVEMSVTPEEQPAESAAVEAESNVVELVDFRELQEQGQEAAINVLNENGLAENLESASVEELEVLVEQLPDLIEALSHDEYGDVRNENRYQAKALSNHLQAAKLKLASKKFPSPLAA